MSRKNFDKMTMQYKDLSSYKGSYLFAQTYSNLKARTYKDSIDTRLCTYYMEQYGIEVSSNNTIAIPASNVSTPASSNQTVASSSNIYTNISLIDLSTNQIKELDKIIKKLF